ncbi:type II toxin-antitoxin system RelE/ParE family toxin [Algoriphagus marinus]|uniref:type II toxin-antitoxin system RelE/ParE family toxin n=1 Tax=Algoriphagus marinus TaxID=1925762 RepID=UPI00094BBA3E
MAILEIRITELAYSDIQEIESYLFKSSPSIGRSFTEKIFRKIELLYDHPEIGRIVPEFRESSIREIFQGKYRIVYLILNSNRIDILRIIHGSKLIDLG